MRQRSRDLESESIPRRAIRPGAVGTDQVEDLAIVKAKLWPGSVDKTRLADGAVEPRHLTREVANNLGKSTVEHVTATAASQSIASGGATVQWSTLASAPTEREGFDTFATEIAGGAVGDIPIDRDGWLHPRLIDVLLSTVVDGDFTFSQIRGGTTRSWVSPQVGDRGDIGFPWMRFKAGDLARVTIDPDVTVDITTMTLDLTLVVTGGEAQALEVVWSDDAFNTAGDAAELTVPSTVQDGDVVVTVVTDLDADGNQPVAQWKTGDSTFLTQLAGDDASGDGWQVAWGTRAGGEILGAYANTTGSTGHRLRIAAVALRGVTTDPTLVDSTEGSTSPLSADGAIGSGIVIALGRGDASTGTDTVTLSGVNFTETAQQSGPEPITAGYGDAGDYSLSWPSGDISAGGVYLVGVS